MTIYQLHMLKNIDNCRIKMIDGLHVISCGCLLWGTFPRLYVRTLRKSNLSQNNVWVMIITWNHLDKKCTL